MEHDIKVIQPYFDAILDGSKTFEIRKNDRAYQKGDVLILREFLPERCSYHASRCKSDDARCPAFGGFTRVQVTYVYSGDPRFGGLEPGHVVLGLGPVGKGSSNG